MAKIQKFNLIIDGESVRDIDQLQDNFCVEDMLDHFKQQKLQKWLKSRGFDEYLAKVEAIDSDSDLEIIEQLMDIFDLEFVQSDVEDMLDQKAKQKQETEPTEPKLDKNVSTATAKVPQESADTFNINQYVEYKQLFNEAVYNSGQLTQFNINVDKILSNYNHLFRIDFIEFCDHLTEDGSPYAIASILNNPKAFKFMISYLSAYTFYLSSENYYMTPVKGNYSKDEILLANRTIGNLIRGIEDIIFERSRVLEEFEHIKIADRKGGKIIYCKAIILNLYDQKITDDDDNRLCYGMLTRSFRTTPEPFYYLDLTDYDIPDSIFDNLYNE